MLLLLYFLTGDDPKVVEMKLKSVVCRVSTDSIETTPNEVYGVRQT